MFLNRLVFIYTRLPSICFAKQNGKGFVPLCLADQIGGQSGINGQSVKAEQAVSVSALHKLNGHGPVIYPLCSAVVQRTDPPLKKRIPLHVHDNKQQYRQVKIMDIITHRQQSAGAPSWLALSHRVTQHGYWVLTLLAFDQ